MTERWFAGFLVGWLDIQMGGRMDRNMDDLIEK